MLKSVMDLLLGRRNWFGNQRSWCGGISYGAETFICEIVVSMVWDP